MATYVIGDIHGCWATLEALLAQLRPCPQDDRVWLIGDLVGRGPSSTKVLTWAFENRSRVNMVLGNHDLHLLALCEGVTKRADTDGLAAHLASPNGKTLRAWLSRRPVAHRHGDYLFVHAGIWPSWSLDTALLRAAYLSGLLQSDDRAALLARVAKGGKHVDLSAPYDSLAGAAASAIIFTRLRMVGPNNTLNMGFTGSPAEASSGHKPWFELWNRKPKNTTVVFGHWARLGSFQTSYAVGLDSGCVYGGYLTAMRVEDGAMFRQPLHPSDHLARNRR